MTSATSQQLLIADDHRILAEGVRGLLESEFEVVGVAGETYDAGRVFARFDPRGAASDHQVVLKQPAYENYFTIEVMALTGTFKFHRDVFIRSAPEDGDFR